MTAISLCRLRQPGPPDLVDVDPARAYHPDFAALLAPGARLVSLYDQATWSEGPVWWETQDTLVWSDVEGRRVLGWRKDGAVDVLVDATAFINGNAVDHENRLVHCEHGRRAISRTEAGQTLPVVSMVDGKRFNSPNDLIVARDGAIWFTDPTFGIENPKQGCPGPTDLGRTSVYRVKPGAVSAERMVDLDQPNGLAFSPDERTLYVSQTPEHGGDVAIYAFAWDGIALRAVRRFATVPSGVPDGFCVDHRGWVWTSSAVGVQIYAADGAWIGEIPTPHVVSNCTFDKAGKRLFVTGRESLWMLSL